MKITKKLIKVANSLGIIIDKPIIKKLELEQGDLIEVSIKKSKNGK